MDNKEDTHENEILGCQQQNHALDFLLLVCLWMHVAFKSRWAFSSIYSTNILFEVRIFCGVFKSPFVGDNGHLFAQ